MIGGQTHVEVIVQWTDEDGRRSGQPGGWYWPVVVPLPQVGDELTFAPDRSPLPGPVRITGRRWVCANLYRGAVGIPAGPGVMLELEAELAR